MIHQQGDSLGKAEGLISVGKAQMTMQQLCNGIVEYFTAEEVDDQRNEERSSLLRYLRKIVSTENSFAMSETRCPSQVVLNIPRHEPESFTVIPFYPSLSNDSEIQLRGHTVSVRELVDALIQTSTTGQADPRTALLKDLRDMHVIESASGNRFEISLRQQLADLKSISFQRFLDS